MGKAEIPKTTEAWLKRELPIWLSEGLIDEAGAEGISRRYQADDREQTSKVVYVIYAIGFLLIGGGIMSFIAWNWDQLPDVAKLSLSGLSMLAAYGIGYWYWKVDASRPALGHSLVALGSLLFGANIGVVSQVFQLYGDLVSGVGLWGAGVALAAWLFMSAPIGLMANAILAGWALERVGDLQSGLPSGVLLVVLLPLAFKLCSLPLYAFCTASIVTVLATEAEWSSSELIDIVWSLMASGGLLLALPCALAGKWSSFRGVSTFLGMGLVIVLGSFLSFHEVSQELVFHWEESKDAVPFSIAQLVGMIGCLVFAKVRSPEAFKREATSVVGLITAVALIAGTLLPEPEVPVAVMANIGLLSIGGYAISSSLRSHRRRAYWAGTVLIALVIVARFFEYETGLLAKAGFFLVCGIIVIMGGLAFERRVNAKESNDVA